MSRLPCVIFNPRGGFLDGEAAFRGYEAATRY